MGIAKKATEAPGGHRQRTILLAATLAVSILALALRVIPVFFWPSVAQADEIFQSVEQGHRLVFGYGLVPWEFEYAVRSWLLPYAAAGIMRAASLFGDGPLYYLPAIGIACAALSAGSAACAFLWGNRFYGFRGGLIAAMVPMTWVDGLYFGARPLSEAIAGHLLVIATYLVAPGYQVGSRRRLALAGFLLASTSLIRIQLIPAVALAFLWGELPALRRRIFPLAAGALAAAGLYGWFEAVTWGYPFQSLWNYFDINYIRDGAANYGTRPWWIYLEMLAGNWGGTIAIVLPLAILGGRKMPLLLAMAVAIFVAHSAIGHKEYRFIYPAILLLTIVVGFGLAEFAGWIAKEAAGQTRHGFSARTTYAAVALCWLLLACVNVLAPNYVGRWTRTHDSLLASLYVSQNMASACGIGFYGLLAYDSGGYTYLHRRVPLYASLYRDEVAAVLDKRLGYNVMVSDMDAVPRSSPTPEALGYRKIACYGSVCIGLRAGGCEALPVMKPGIPPPVVPSLPPYPQSNGVTDLPPGDEEAG